MKPIKHGIVEFKIECLPEDTEIRGNALASGDDAIDKAHEDMLIEQYNSGNEWAWCCVKVTATIPGLEEIEGTDYLGCCSYKSEEDFKKDGSFKDMCKIAKDELLMRVKELKNKLSTIEVQS